MHELLSVLGFFVGCFIVAVVLMLFFHPWALFSTMEHSYLWWRDSGRRERERVDTDRMRSETDLNDEKRRFLAELRAAARRGELETGWTVLEPSVRRYPIVEAVTRLLK